MPRDMDTTRCRECELTEDCCKSCRKRITRPGKKFNNLDGTIYELTCTCGQKNEVKVITPKLACPFCGEQYI